MDLFSHVCLRYPLCTGCELPWWLRQLRICLQCRRPGFNSWVWKIPWRRAWPPTPVFLPGEFPGQRSLSGYIVHGVAKSQTRRKQLTRRYVLDVTSFAFHRKSTSKSYYLTWWEMKTLDDLTCVNPQVSGVVLLTWESHLRFRAQSVRLGPLSPSHPCSVLFCCFWNGREQVCCAGAFLPGFGEMEALVVKLYLLCFSR